MSVPKRVLSQKAEEVALLVVGSGITIREAMAHVGWDEDSDGPFGTLSAFVSRNGGKLTRRQNVRAGAVFGSLTVSEVLPGRRFRVIAACSCGAVEEMGGCTVQAAQKCTACHATERVRLGQAKALVNTERAKAAAEKNKVGRKYGTMLVLEPVTRTIFGRIRWRCRCDKCGSERLMGSVALKHHAQRHPDKCVCARAKSGLAPGDVTPTGWKMLANRRAQCVTCSRMVYTTNTRIDRKKPCSVCHPEDMALRPGGVPWWYYRHLAGRGKRVTVTLEQLDTTWRASGGRCALSGLPITFEDRTASLDRINSEIGYEAGNIQWVHKHINRMKLDHPETTFVELCRAVVRHYDSKEAKRARRTTPQAIALPFSGMQ